MYGHVITKFSRMGSLPYFVTHGAPLRASRARAPLVTPPPGSAATQATFDTDEKSRFGFSGVVGNT